MSVRVTRLCALLASLLTACGSSSEKSNVDVTVTMDGVHHACNVALTKEAQGSSVACGDVVPFLRDELRLQSGAVYELRADQKVDPAELKTVSATLNSAGYRSAK